MNRPLPAAQVESNSRDQALLRLVAAGDRPAFEELYGGYHRRLSRFLARLTRRYDLVEEVINDTFWIVWQKAGDFRGSSLVSTWIMGIAYRCTLKSLRRGGAMAQVEPLALDDDHPAADARDAVAAEEQREWIMRGLSHLPVEQRVTLQLAYYLGHSLEEIAQIMDCPLSTVKARMFHARVKLRNLLPRLGGMENREA